MPVHEWFEEPLGDRPGEIEAAVRLGDVPGLQGDQGAIFSGPVQQDRVIEPLSLTQRAADHSNNWSTSCGMLRGKETPLTTRTMVTSSPEDRARATASSASAWRRSRPPAQGEPEHRVARTGGS
ncbi:MAG: hypothetical protein WKF58_16010 [Ilumatobacteraceae bacterium]